MRRASLAGIALVALASNACGGADPLVEPRVVTTVAAPPKPEPPLLHVDGATFDARREDRHWWGDDVAFRSQGAGAILYGTNDGVLLVSAANGVEGFFRTPATLGNLRWGGFGKNDAVLLVVGTKLVRAPSIADALAGKFVDLPSTIDPSLDLFASSGDVFVTGSKGGAYFESTDGGKTLKKAMLPASLPLSQLVVRDDGLVLAAFETGRKPGKYGGTTIHAQTWTKRKPGAAWTKGALVQGHEPALVDVSGAVVEAIRIEHDPLFDADEGKAVALDAKGTWIETGWTSRWLQLWPSPSFEPIPPPVRPAMPKTKADDMNDLIGGLTGSGCTGVSCLSHREYKVPAPHGYVLDDAICDASAVVDKPEEVEAADAPGKKQTIHRNVCDEKKPAARTATLVETGAGLPTWHRLPSWCSSGALVGSDLWPIVHCDTRYGGKGVLVSLAPDGSFAELGPLPAESDWRRRSERSADGTTVIVSEGAFALCDPKARSCSLLGKDGSLLAARPLDGGRAIVATASSSPDVVKLSLGGRDAKELVDVRVVGDLVDFGVTDRGRVWLTTKIHWQSAPLRPGPKNAVRRWLVRADGSLEDAAP